jgi:hypothetical protein
LFVFFSHFFLFSPPVNLTPVFMYRLLLLNPVYCLFVPLLLLFSGMAQAQLLKVSPNKRYIVKQDGTPFFYLGDTAWELFHRLNREEADKYLQNRAEKGFTVIQAVVLAELDGLNDPNPYGHTPLKNNDPIQPNEDYFKHVDYIVNKAAELGLYIAMLPTWGDKLYKDNWGTGPEIFNPQNAKAYGEYIGKRYANKPVIWVMGGDRNPRNDADVAIWRSMAEGIVAGVGGKDNALITFHPQPKEKGGSSTWFHNDDWLDFNMFQTGHCRNSNVYEDHPVCFNANDLGYSAAYDVRRAAYLDLFAGAHGHTYGCHSVWQMYAPNRNPVNGPLKPWFESLDLPGASDMTHVRALIESRPMLDRVPDQSLIASGTYAEGDRIQATRGKDYLFVYTNTGRPFTLLMGKISGKQVKGFWYDPREGTSKAIPSLANTGKKEFTPPSSGLGKDWVLILDDAGKNYKEPQKIVTRKNT